MRFLNLSPRLSCMCIDDSFARLRTTIEIPDDTRAKLLELAVRRGEKEFSGIVQEASRLLLRGGGRAGGRLITLLNPQHLTICR